MRLIFLTTRIEVSCHYGATIDIVLILYVLRELPKLYGKSNKYQWALYSMNGLLYTQFSKDKNPQR